MATLTFEGSHGHVTACAVSGHIIEATACSCDDCGTFGGYTSIALVDVLALDPAVIAWGGGDILDAALIYQDGGYVPPVPSIDGDIRDELLRLPAPAPARLES